MPAESSGAVLIVTYHAVGPRPSPVVVTPHRLEADLTALLENGFRLVSLDDCADWLSGHRELPARSAVVTFDDAYASVVLEALPILTRLRVPTTVFVIGGRIGNDNQWAGQWRSVPRMPLADAAQIRDLIAAGLSIGSHTWSHPDLACVDEATLQAEICDSADRLEQAFATPIRHFAYPYGRRSEQAIAMVRRRYRTAVNAQPGLVASDDDPYDLNRADCEDVPIALKLRLNDPPLLTPYLAARSSLRRVRRQIDRMLLRA